ncbi:unnamed protein product [Caenorhabditis angaria]|uniref:G-protein coupled receptors family 1 profile domain-containing protein n=1 Tax=Caenorhabditis angaria TaxID=860376 RepID=A0A9P1N5Y7_9PELO|nr:unnamed protein product [Caenorhabditis angaria]
MYIDIFDQLYISYSAVFASLGIFLNLFLIFLILFKSPSCLTPYTVFLANTSVTQLFYSICYLLTIPRVLTIKLRVVVIYLGISQFFGHWWSYMIFVTMLHFVVNSFLSIMLSMIFRCISLQTLRFPTSAAILMCSLAYLIPLSMVISSRDMEFTSNFTINQVYTLWQIDNLDKYNTVVGADVSQKSTLWISFCVSVLFTPIYIVMYYCRSRILKMLERPGYLFNTSTTLQIRKLVKALTVQSIIPSVTLFPASIIFVCTQFHVIETCKFGYIIISLISLSSTIDPLVTIYYVQPYRKYIIDLLSDPRPAFSDRSHSYRSRSNSTLMMRNAAFV